MSVPLWARVVAGVGVATAVAFLTTPVAVAMAQRFSFYDVPRGYKGHKQPTPYLGGAAVVAAFAVALLVGAGHLGRTLPLVGGVLTLFVIGTIDDRRTLSPLMRVAMEFALGVLVTKAGLGWHLGAGQLLDAVVTGVWVVAVVNAFNLFDNMDGAASSMAFVVAAGACVLALVSHDQWVGVGSAALCGACLGFLPHNLARPARIFLGDGGSMPLGFAVAVLVASAARGAEPSVLAMLVGALLVGIPALDTCLVIVSRRRRGISILTGGQDHLTHRTRRRLRTARRVALVLGSVQALVSALVIVATRASSAALVYIVLAFVVVAAVAVVGLEEAGVATTEVDEAGIAPRAVETGSAAKRGRAAQGRPGGAGARAGATRLAARTSARRAAMGAVLVLGLGVGLSAFFSAYYDTGVWVPLGLGVTLAAAAAAVARPPRITRPMLLSLVGVAGLGLWSLLSTSWASGVEAATVDANRWLAYAALLLLMFVLLSSRRRTIALFAAIGIGVAVIGLSVLMRMLGSDPSSLFIGGRLNSPLGYINGEGCLFAMGAWGAVALAERREPVVAGVGAAGAVLMVSLTLLSQSRDAAIATFVALIVVLAVVPGWRRRAIASAVIAAGFALAAGPVLRVYTSAHGGVVSSASAHHAAVVIILCALGAGVVWGFAAARMRSLELDPSRRHGLRRGVTAAAVAVLLAPLIAALAAFPSIRQDVSRQWHAFVHLSDAGSSSAASQTRLFSGAGNRYDYWRVAWHAFEDHPLAGVGAGNYSTVYYQQRSTLESIENPHSIELEMLAELGIVGAALLALLVAGVVIGAARLRRVAIGSPIARTMMVAATGAAVVWFVDTSGDWMELLPGLTAIALACAVVLCRDWQHEPERPNASKRRMRARVPPSIPPPTRARVPTLAGAALVAFVLAITGAGLARAGLVQHYVDDARGEVASTPAAAIRDAGRALRLDGADLDAYYLKAAGEARFDQAAAARATLLGAVSEDPKSFVTWTLLGDLEVRVRNFASARAFYGRAHALDPRDPGLVKLARDPASALSGAGG